MALRLLWLATIVSFIVALGLTEEPNSLLVARSATFNLWLGKQVICTAFAVQTPSDTKVITAGHCVANNPGGQYSISQDRPGKTRIDLEVEAWAFQWPGSDHAILKPTSKMPGFALPMCKKKPEPGETVWSWTGPGGTVPILHHGIYSGELWYPANEASNKKWGGMGFVQINGDKGSSGSGMLRYEGNTLCAWGIWVGQFTPDIKLDGALVVDIPYSLLNGGQ